MCTYIHISKHTHIHRRTQMGTIHIQTHYVSQCIAVLLTTTVQVFVVYTPASFSWAVATKPTTGFQAKGNLCSGTLYASMEGACKESNSIMFSMWAAVIISASKLKKMRFVSENKRIILFNEFSHRGVTLCVKAETACLRSRSRRAASQRKSARGILRPKHPLRDLRLSVRGSCPHLSDSCN
jgi:hypothetical protein